MLRLKIVCFHVKILVKKNIPFVQICELGIKLNEQLLHVSVLAAMWTYNVAH